MRDQTPRRARLTRRLLITAGPTHEPIDDVRYLANRSSGRLGLALAEAGRDAGWDVVLLLGPVAAAPPTSVRVRRFDSTAALQKLLADEFPACDVLIMAAAVADYRPALSRSGKIPRREERLVLELEPTPDLVAELARTRRPGQRIIGFALEEPSELTARATEKLRRKGLDAIVANPLETMGADQIAAVVYTTDGRRLTPGADPASGDAPAGGSLSKRDFARWLIAWLSSEA